MTLRTTLAGFASVAVLCMFGASLDAQTPAAVTPVTDATLQNPDPGDWLNWRRTLDGWGYSPLDEIDRTNVGELQLAWKRGSPDSRSQPSTETTQIMPCNESPWTASDLGRLQSGTGRNARAAPSPYRC